MITTKRPEVNLKGIYNITQIAAILGVNRLTVRRYMASGALKFNIRKTGNRKACTGLQIVRCWEAMYM